MKNKIEILFFAFLLSLSFVSAFESEVYNINVGVNTEGINVDIENPLSVNIIECVNGTEKCTGTESFLCSSNSWVSQGQINGKCGYTAGTGGNPSGGGGGGSSSNTGGFELLNNNLQSNVNSLSGGLNILEQGINYSFISNSEIHTLVIDEFGENYAWIIIYSEPQRIKININETQEIDLDNDGINEISVKLVSIEGNKIQLEYSSLIQADVINLSETPKTTITGAVIGTLGTTGTIIAVIFIAGISATLVFILMRKKKN